MENNKLVYPQGRKEIALAAGQVLTVQSVGAFQIYQKGTFVNEPDNLLLVSGGNVAANTETTFTPAGGVALTYVILAGAAKVNYAVGLAPRVLAQQAAQTQPAPGVLNATGTLTAAMMAAGIVTSTTAAAVAGTVDTGAIMDTTLDMAIGDSFDWSLINTGGNTFTVTASTGHTIVGVATVLTVSSGHFRTRKTAASTFITYRMGGN